MPATATVTAAGADTFGWTEFAAQSFASLLGVLGALLVYFLSTRATRRAAAADASTRAASALLVAVMRTKDNLLAYGVPQDEWTWADLSLVVTIETPRLTDHAAARAVRELLVDFRRLRSGTYPEDGTESGELYASRRASVRLAVAEAKEALSAHLLSGEVPRRRWWHGAGG